MKPRRKHETFSFFVGVSPVAGVWVHYSWLVPDHAGFRFQDRAEWLVPGTFSLEA